MRLAQRVLPALGAVARRGAIAGPSRPAALLPRRSVSSKVEVEPSELDIVFPRESPAEGFSYDLNWSLCQHGVIPNGKAFRNLKAPQLKELGGAAAVDAPKTIPWDAALERELKAHLCSAKTTCYVQDCALGAIAANEVAARIVSDSPAAALAFRTLCSTTKAVPVSEQKCEVVVLHASKLGSHPAFITMNPKTKTILMGGSINAGALVGMLEGAATDSFLGNGVLPLWGPGDANNETVFLSAGFDAGASKVKHGFAYSRSGFCRLFMGSAAADGKVVDEYKLLPNSLPAPKVVVMFANDASATIPAAAKLTPEQAAFYFVAACAPKGTTAFGNGAALVQEMAKSVAFYVVNKGAFEVRSRWSQGHTPHPIGAVLMDHRLNGVKFVARGLGARPERRALCTVAVAAGNGGSINAGGDLAEAKERLVKAESELVAVKDLLRKAEEAVPVDAQRVAEAKLGVAEAELGVAKAELSVAKAELSAIEAKWQAAQKREKAVFLSSVRTAQEGVKTAQECVRTANMAYEKALNAPAATPQQATVLTVITKTGKDRKTEHTSTIKFFSEAGFKSFLPSPQIWHMKKVKGRPDERISLMASLVDAVNASQQPDTYLYWDNPDDILREDVSSLKGAEKNRATGQEQETTKAMLVSQTLEHKYGPLSVVNGNLSVVFERNDGAVKFECDGLVKNSKVVLLNEAKSTPTMETIGQLKLTAHRLEAVLKNPHNYTSTPGGVLSELVGLTDVVPVMSGYCFETEVMQFATSEGILCMLPNGLPVGRGIPEEFLEFLTRNSTTSNFTSN